MPKVAVIIGSTSDKKAGDEAVEILKEFGVEFDYRVLSAHRNPDELDAFIKSTDAEVFIAIAGLSAALPGFIASKTIRPVIGVPINVKLEGLDAFLSMAQMPSGIPVATVGVDNAKNGAYLALEILALKYSDIRDKLLEKRGLKK
ncbi:MAG: 5-(carboxyamino)imidazole ribonucleotide mutase [Candidatus Methanomethylicota archaeon]|jgi:5-(carboxyamino)imidazole ribonucleotide mutase|uniref:N5-carboxyaminoimidazole ribonucleotide mutase n=1 Tax=Thermoproteota archaeon TaxID=2056631 RepID=A0A520KFX2_9CREN|nr:5-(carboxyamino)imidazole ribonucleotide mutase [Candidatus Verstraetearchaeota archaeon]RZN56417.1 MAG: 5-(carboxyamino)imidazole ribonucleotide mutase [Candidatus Verstraetearchaeota archaeon]